MKQTGKKIVAYLLACLVFVLVFVLTFYLEQFLPVYLGFCPPRLSDFGTTIWALLSISIPILTGWFVARAVSNRYNRKKGISLRWIPRNKIVVRVIIGLYLITAFAGIPSILSQKYIYVNEANIRISGDRGLLDGDGYYNFFSMPVLPFVILSYHEQHIGMIDCWGAWDFQLWYLTGSITFLHVPFWLA